MVARLSPLLGAYLLALPLLLTAPAHAGPGSERAVDETRGAENAPVMRERNGIKTGFVWIDRETQIAPDALAAVEVSHVIFVNRCLGGCTIQPGVNDARANTSSIASSTSTLTAFPYGDEIWDATIDCIRDVYSPYDVEVVTEDPGPDIFHHEAILAGGPEELGLAGNIGGIAPSSCEPANNVISFSFANAPSAEGGDPLAMCWTVAQESAHAFGLPNHVLASIDPMTYNRGDGTKKYFRNQNLPCGEFATPMTCNCSGATQNSHVELRTVFGDGTAPPPPALTLLLPKQDAAVTDGFAVYWDSQDPRLVLRNELWINGTKYKDVPGHPYEQRFDDYNTTAPSLPDGYIDIEVKSYNELGSESVATVTVLKGAACANADSCFDFQECNEGRCEYPPASAELGDTCDVTPQCLEGLCAQVGGSSACSVTCNPSVSGACADGFECKTGEDGGFVCWPQGDTGGCCTIAASKHDPMPWVGASIFLLGLVLLRRRRS